MHGENTKESALQVCWNACITKYAGLISFRISVCKKPGVPLLCPTVNNSENEAVRPGGQARAPARSAARGRPLLHLLAHAATGFLQTTHAPRSRFSSLPACERMTTSYPAQEEPQ